MTYAKDLKPGDVIDAVPLLGPDPDVSSATAVVEMTRVYAGDDRMVLKVRLTEIDGASHDRWGQAYRNRTILDTGLPIGTDLVIREWVP